MAGSQALPPPTRASDADRDRVLRVLRDGAVAGRLSHDSFVRRVDLALGARDLQALDELLADLPRRRYAFGVVPLTSLVAVATRLWNRSDTVRLPGLSLPRVDQPVFTIGRAPDCDLVLRDTTVSRRHAVLRRFGDQWFLDDLSSTNGTRVNGWRLRSSAVVRPGDRVGFGRPVFRLQSGD